MTQRSLAMIAVLLTACGPVEIELLAPREAEVREPSAPVFEWPDASSPAPEDAGHPSHDAGTLPEDAGPVPQDAGLSPCAPDMLICDDFEDSLAGWNFVRSEGNATITTLDRHSGAGSLELSTGTTGAFAFFEHDLPHVTSGSVHLRAFVKLPGDQVLERFDMAVFTNAASDAGVAVSYGEQTLSVASVTATSSAPSSLGFPRDTWACVELTLTSSAAPSAALDVNSTRVATLMLEGVPSDGITRVRLGIVRSSATQPPMRILLDDLVVASAPIGCE